MPQRVRYERDAIETILDEALVAHLGFAVDGQPYTIPTVHARIGGSVFFHGSAGSRTLRAIAAGGQVCLTVTLIDGLVLARSALHHSVNYRSVMVFGQAQPVTSLPQRRAALRAFMDKLIPGRWEEVRSPTDRDLRVTSILSMPLTEASAKLRTGPPLDEPGDYGMGVWAGTIPLALRAAAPVPDARLPSTIEPSIAVRSRVSTHR